MSRNDDWSEKILVVGLLLTVVAVALFFWQKQRAGTSEPQAPTASVKPAVPSIRGKEAPEFELPSLDGSTVRRADFNGKVLMVNFWATWCAPCELEIPWFIEFDQKYRSKGLEILGISLDEEKPDYVSKWVAKKKISYSIVMGNEKVAEAFGGVMGLPTTYLVDRNGKFYSMHRGLVGKDSIEEELQILLEQPAASASSSAGSAGTQTSEPAVSATVN